MTPAQWSRVKEMLHAALALQAEERSQYLSEGCGGDASLRREVEELLAFEEPAKALALTRWVTADQAEEDCAPEPERIGPYRIVRRVGEGGMGIVYRAEREGEFHQQVAIKVLKAGAHPGEFLKMFLRERQILARLEHPNIAHILDGGTTPDGRPYYVMQYVEGRPITVYSNEGKLGLRRRLELFCAACNAVSHAHRNLVIHRDLKPGNILVTVEGVPKLLDFGLAKVLGPEPGEAQTVTLAPILTPGYASPEQVRGEHLTTATDVYSLGALFYELLTGTGPYLLREKTLVETCRAILEQEPRRPSQAVRERKKEGEAAPVSAAQLAGDLDDIALKALRKEPERRYASIDEFRQDIERHLNGYPVRASHGAARYRLGKFVRRHGVGVVSAVLGGVAALAAVMVILWQARQTELRFQEVRQLAHSVVFELHDAIRDLPGSTAARKLLVERALQYLRSLEATRNKDRGLQMELAAAYRKIGEVQWSPIHAHLSDTAGAADSFERGRRILLDLLRSRPDDSDVLAALGELDEEASYVYFRRGDSATGRQRRGEASDCWRKLARLHPQMSKFSARVLAHEASTLANSGDWRPAIPAYQRALAAYQQAAIQEPHNLEVARMIAESHRRLAHAYHEVNEFTPALEHYRTKLRLDEAVLSAAPNDSEAKMQVSLDYSDVGWMLYRLGRAREAVQSQERGLSLQEELAAADPQNLRIRHEIPALLIAAAPAYEAAGNRDKAITVVRRAAEAFQLALGRDRGDENLRDRLGWAYSDLGDLYARRAATPTRHPGDWENAAAAYERAIEAYRPLKAYDGIPIPRLQRLVAECRRRASQ